MIDYDAVRRLMALVMERLDASGPTDLVVKLGLSAELPNAPRLATNWIEGVNAPRFDYTMLMLSKAGLLTPEADRAWRGQAPDPAAEVRAATAAAREAERKLGDQPGRAKRARRGTGNR